jgi:hypothetical protein
MKPPVTEVVEVEPEKVVLELDRQEAERLSALAKKGAPASFLSNLRRVLREQGIKGDDYKVVTGPTTRSPEFSNGIRVVHRPVKPFDEEPF